MSLDSIHHRLKNYTLETKQSELNAIKEICQDIVLSGLSRSDFFKFAMFQGGTCLRIIHGLQRFSEDLDFILIEPKTSFQWEPYLHSIQKEFEVFGLTLSASDKSKAPNHVKKAFLKENSFGQILNLKYKKTRSDKQNIVIKLEIDTNPPLGSCEETHILDFPYPMPILTQDLPSLFAGKCHALLCRQYMKGRDWFDFIWYIQNKTNINYPLLKNALEQHGPYQGQSLPISKTWLTEALTKKINTLNWQAACDDVRPFLPNELMHTLDHWNKALFLKLLKKLP